MRCAKSSGLLTNTLASPYFPHFLKFIPYHSIAIDTDWNGTSLGRILEEYWTWPLLSNDYNLVGKVRHSH